MLRVLRLAWAMFLMQLKRRLAYRGDLAIQAMDELLRGLVALAMLKVYVSKTSSIGGYGPWELLFILGYSLVPISLFHCLCGNLYQVSSRYILDGQLDRILLRPYPVVLQICFDRLGIEDLGGAVLGVTLMAIAAGHLPALWDAGHLLALVVLLASSFVLVTAIFMIFAASGFWFEDRVGMVPPVYNLMEFGRWPVDIYHWALKLLITCVIPFAFIAFYPAGWLVGRGDGWLPALLTPVIATLAFLVAMAVWRAGVRRYSSAGS